MPEPHYYDARPLVTLERHVCVVGHRGARADAVVRYIGALLGLNYTLLDDAVAHDLGESPLSFIGREGLNVYRHLEAGALRKLVKRRPHALIACSSDTLTGWWTRTTVRHHSTVIWLETSLTRLLDNARKDQRIYPGLPAYILPEVMAAHCQASWQGKDADVRLDVNTSMPSVLALQLMKQLGWQPPAIDVQAS